MTRLVRDDGTELALGGSRRALILRVWDSALFLAAGSGWKPAGTEPPLMPRDVATLRGKGGNEGAFFERWERKIAEWDGSFAMGGYTGTIGALVTGEDSRAMGQALVVAIKEKVPDRATSKPSAPGKVMGMIKAEQRGVFATTAEQMGGPGKPLLRELAAFLLVGEPFRIH